MIRPQDIITFWADAGPEKWFIRDEGLDDDIRRLFLDEHFAATRGEYHHWMDTPEGALALMILLDQFPRNLFRGSAHAFASDPLALALAGDALERGYDRQVDPALSIFFYLPFEHSEDLVDQDRSVALFCSLHERHDQADYLRYAEIHRDVIARFGRFPHRNTTLGRKSTAEEQAFLEAGGFRA